jgi:hypothetical protein
VIHLIGAPNGLVRMPRSELQLFLIHPKAFLNHPTRAAIALAELDEGGNHGMATTITMTLITPMTMPRMAISILNAGPMTATRMRRSGPRDRVEYGRDEDAQRREDDLDGVDYILVIVEGLGHIGRSEELQRMELLSDEPLIIAGTRLFMNQ